MELTRTVPRFRVHAYEPLLCSGLVGCLRISLAQLTSFWSRLGYVVEVRRTVRDHGPVNRSLTYESTALNVLRVCRYRRSIACSASGCAARIPLQAVSAGHRFCASGILCRSDIPCDVHRNSSYVPDTSPWLRLTSCHRATIPWRSAHILVVRFCDSGPSMMRAWSLVCWMDEWGPVASGEMLHVGLSRPPTVHPNQVI
jgi:hypothetical protein